MSETTESVANMSVPVGPPANKLAVPHISISKMTIRSSMEIRALRRDMRPLEESFRKRRIDDAPLRAFIAKDKEWRDTLSELNKKRSKKNGLTLEISKDRRNKELLELARAVGNSMIDIESRIKGLSEERERLLLALPNLVDPLMPMDELKNIAFVGVPKVDVKRIADFEEKYPEVAYTQTRLTKMQYDIIREYGLADEAKGAELAGARFYYKMNELTLLNLALSLHAVKMLRERGFRLMTPPYLVKRQVEMMATSMDAFEEAIYKVEGEDLYLIPTSEHPIAAYNSNTTFKEVELPLRLGGFSTSFRREAGAHGKDTKGIYRNHHFDKVEQYIICTPEQVEDELNRVIGNQASLLTSLGIPFRAIILPTWDMDKKAVFHIDLEGWFPGQTRYGELGSHANVGTWQASRLNIKYTPTGATEPVLVSTIYGTLVPVERTLACVLENSIDENGVIHMPKVLSDISGVDTIIPVQIRKN